MNSYPKPIIDARLRFLAAILMATSVFTVRAVNVVQEFYLPMPEQQVYTALNTIVPGTGTTQDSIYSIVATGDGTVIIYDQWEDGYETDLSNPTQASTKIWGDGNDANGIPPGFAHDPVGLPAGTVITLTNNVALPRNPSVLLYDGRDRIGGSKALVVTHAGWPATQGPVYAGSVSVYSTIDYGTNYISPVGQDITNNLFKYVGLFVMASQNGTSVTIDPDGAGAGAATNIVLNQGESYLVNGGIKKGASVASSKPVQAHLIIGDTGTTYAADWFTLSPVEQWSDSYYTPVGSASSGTQPTYVYLYNPNTTNITVNYATTLGAGSIVVLAKNTAQFQMPQKSGASFISAGGAHLYALCTVAANNSNDSPFNWGFSLLPKQGLTTEADVGWAPGSSGNTVNGSPVWVTALAATRIYVDYKGDHAGSLTDPKGNKYDTNYDVTALQSVKIFDPSKDQTAMRVYTLDSTLITAAWGEDADTAASGNPYIDAGTVVLPFPVPVIKKSSTIVIDVAPTNNTSVGDTLEYTVQLDNKGLLPLGNVVVIDAPPANLSYVSNSTTLNGQSLPDSASGTAFPLDSPGYTIPVILRSGSSVFKYRVVIVAGGVITNVVTAGNSSISAQNVVSTTTNSSTISFTDSATNAVSSYIAGTNVYLKLTDPGANTSTNTKQTLTITVNDSTHGDFETVLLTETGTNTGVFFGGPLPTSLANGTQSGDGTLNVVIGDTLTVNFIDPSFGNSASASATIVSAPLSKLLYLSGASQALNRIDPVFYNHSPTQSSTDIGSGSGGGSSAAIGLDATNTFVTSGPPPAITSVTNSITVGNGTNRLLLVGIASTKRFATNVTATAGSTRTLTFYGAVTNGTGGTAPYVSIWYLTNAASGANSVVSKFTGPVDQGVIVGVISLTNVDQSSPLGTFATTTSGGNGFSVNITNVPANGWVFDTAVLDKQKSVNAGNNQTQLWDLAGSSQEYGASIQTNGASVGTLTSSWGTTGSPNSALAAVAIRPATVSLGGGPTTNATSFTQTPNFASSFTIVANQTITITNFITITNGAGLFSSTPAVTATLLYGTTPITTLSNVTYTSGNNSLFFTGTVPTNVTVPAGQAITYVISNNVANTAFHVNYDSTTAPSRISLPAGNVIHINSLNVYDAPNPGGNLVTSPTAGSKLYVRANVSDPFGNYDISSVNFAITAPAGGGNVNTNLTVPVATDATSATYEFAWQTDSTTGNYSIASTANEGTEGIKDVASATVSLIFLDLGTPSTSEFTSGPNGTTTNGFAANSSVCIRINDADQNLTNSLAESLIATVTSSAGDSELVTLTETTTNSGIFVACIASSTSLGVGTNNGTLYAPVGSQLTLSYTDPNDPTDQSTASAIVVPPPGVPGIAVNKTLVSPASGKAVVGDTVQFNLQVINTGSTTLPNVVLSDAFPSANLTFQSASLAPDVTNASSLIWTNLGTFTPGQSTNISVFFTTIAAATATNSAGTGSGATTNNNVASVIITRPALTITKTLLSPTNSPVSIGSNVVFRIVAQNTGTTVIPTLPMEDTFSSAYLQFVSATIPADGSGAGSLLWTNLASPTPLAVNASITNDITMLVVGAGNPAANTAIVDFGVDGNGKPVPPTSVTCTNLVTAAASINGHVYDDVDQSGNFTTNVDIALSGVTLSLYTDPNGDGNPADGTLQQVTTTDVNGYYEFLNLLPGNYVVVETDQAGYASTVPANNRRAVNANALTTFPNNDFFDYQINSAAYGTISGTVYYDANGNGTNDLAETPLANVNIALVQDVNSNGVADFGEPVVTSTTTDTNGNYQFVALVPNRYVVRETDLFGYYSSGDAQLPNDNQIGINVTAGSTFTNQSFYDRLSPTGTDDTSSGPRNTGIVISPLGNDISPNGDTLTICGVSSTNGNVVINGGATSLTFTPTNLGLSYVTYTLCDGHGGSSTATITVTATNVAPVAVSDSYSVNQDTTLNISAPGVLSNDNDVNGDSLQAIQITGASHGSVTLNLDGSFSYTPTGGYVGSDSFTYQATDGVLTSASATVNINVLHVNHAPSSTDDSYNVNEDTLLNISAPGVLGNDTDIDGDPITAILVATTTNGTLALNPNGSFTYTPNTNFNGTDTFTYKASDGSLAGNIATVTITIGAVDDPPVAADDTYSVNEDTVLNVPAPGVLTNDTDIDSTNITAALISGPSHGTLTLNADGSFLYTPATNYNGPDSFVYKAVDDQTNSSTATVNITVNPVNDAPVGTDDSYNVNEDSTLNISAPGVLGNDTDVDGDTINAVLVAGPAHGTLNLNSDGSFTYTPGANYNGSDSFTYKPNDGTADGNTATVNITVNPVNDAPVAFDDTYSVNEDTTLNVSAPGVLGNDTDIENDSLSSIFVAGPSHGSLTLNPDGSFSYTPAANYNGPDSFTYKVNDGTVDGNTATVNITVNPVNDAPVAVNDSYSINEDTTLNVSAPGVLGNDTDVENDSLSSIFVAGPSHGSLTLNPDGSFSYTPATNYNGPDGFTYKVNDGTVDGNTATVNITVNPVNDAPVAVDDSYSVNEDTTLTISAPGVLGNDSDVDGNAITAVLVTGTTNGTLTLNNDGSFSYTPTNNYNGADSFTYKPNDGTVDGNVATVNITVTPVNDPPVAADDNYIAIEDSVLNVPAPGVLTNDTDVDSTNLTATLVSGPSHGTLTLNLDGSFTYTPTPLYAGPDSFVYQANDDQTNSSTATVNITVRAINHAPVANDDSYSLNEDTTLNISGPGVLGNDTDVDSDPLSATLVTGPTHGNLTLNSDGSFSYTPDANYNGGDSFTYTATDGLATSSTATVTLTINPVNDAPVAVNDSYNIDEDTTLNVSAPGVLSNDTDVENDPLSSILVAGTSHGSLTLNPDGSFSYTPAANYNGPDSFTYKVNDGTVDGNTAIVNITVNPVNDAPVAINDVYSINEDTTLTISAPGVLGNDSDVDGDAITAVLVVGPTNGTLTLNSDGSFNYTPTNNYNGPDSFTYKANDGTVDGNTATVSITVNAVNDPPVAVNDSYSVNEDTTLNISAPGVLGNDTDVDSTNLTATLLAGPSHGTLTLNTNGSFTYTPDANYNGADSFTYQANDDQTNSSTATVSITVNAVNDAPVAVNDSYSINEDTTLNVSAPGVLGNDTDVENDSLSSILVAGPSHGSLTLNPDGSFSYTPDANYNGADSFTYKPNDGTADGNTATVNITVNPVNDAPVAVNDSYNINEDTTLNVSAPGVLSNDTDVENDPLSSILVAGTSHGSLTLNPDGSFSYTPAANYNGPDSFTYKVNDGTVDGNTAIVNITVNPVNDAPVAINDVYSINEDTTLNISAPGVLGNDSDIDGDVITAIVVSGPAHGSLTLNANGSFSYTPAANYNGPDSFTYKPNDGTIDGNIATVSITVNPVNDAPVAVNDSYSVNEDTTLNVSAPGVLSNDSDVDGDTITAIVVSTPSHGTLSLNANGSFTYTPSTNYNGPDSFTYKVNDGTVDGNTATVNITVNAINDPPVAVNDSYNVLEDGVLNVAAPGVLANDSDIDSAVITASLVAGPSHGTLTLNPDGSFTYTPTPLYNGPDSFTYQASDGSLNSSTATANITVKPVNHDPVANNDTYSVNEDTTLNVPATGVLGNDTDADNDTLTASLVSGPSHGSLTLNPDGSFSYTPAANYNGSDSFIYVANDGITNSPNATVSITINPVNDAPVANNDSYSINEDTTLNISAPGLLGNDTDIDGDTLNSTVVTGPAHGSLTLNPNGSFSYTPALNYNGPDSFTYVVNDGTVNGNTATVNITVNPVNDAPVANNDSYSTAEDTALTIAAPGVLANDSDVDGDVITAALISGPTHGTLTLNPNGSFTYTPATNYNGADSFTYAANDGTVNGNTATVDLTITPVNDAPVAQNDSYSINEDTTLTISAPGVLGNDSDIDSAGLTATLVTGPTNGTLTLNSDGSFNYTPNTNYNGPDTFTYKASDGQTNSSTATVSITVNPVNDAPVAVNDNYSVNEDTTLTISAPGILSNDTDVENDPLHVSATVTGPAHGSLTLNADGSFIYTPNANYNGADSFSYKANDGSVDSGVATVTLTINPVNDAPVANNDSYITAEDAPLTISAPGVLANDSDVDADPITAILVSGPSHGTLNLGPDGSFLYTPAPNYNGSDSFTYKANDGALDSSVATVNIVVTPVNDAPVANNDSYILNEDTPLTVAAPGVLANDTDVDGDTLHISAIVTGPSHGSLTLNANGSFTYTPNANYNGSDSFSYKANDGIADSGVASVTLTINPVNDAPVANNDAYTTAEDTVLTVASVSGVLANDSDVDGDPLTAVLVSGPSHGSLSLAPNGSFSYTPNTNYNGADSFTYAANDGTVNGNTATVNITVTPVNDAPVAQNDSYSINEDTTLNISAPGVLGNDSDIDSAGLTASLVTGPTNGTLTLNSDGSFNYTPNANYNGPDTFTYQASDSQTNSSTATVTITVNPVNDAPVANNDLYVLAEDSTLTISAPGFLGNDTDVENDPLHVSAIVTGVSHGSLTVNVDGSFSYTPNADYNGIDTFSYKANDGTTNSGVATVTLLITPVNDAPVANNDFYFTSEDNALVIGAPGVLANDSDVDADPISAILVTGPANGTLNLNPDGSFIYTPNLNFNGLDSFTYKANDGALDSAVATVNIIVSPVNDAPVANNDSYTLNEDTVLNVPAPGVLANDTDVDGDVLHVSSIVVGPAHGILNSNPDGSFTYTPNANYNGPDSFSYKANDGTLDSGIATVSLTINPVNDAPVANDDSYTTAEDTALTIPAPLGVLANDTDVDGDTLTTVLVSGPAHGTLTLNPDGSFTYSPSANYNGSDSFTYKATDGQLQSGVATVNLTITSVDDAPVANNDSYSVNEDATLTVPAPGVLGNDTDVDNTNLTATVVSGPSHGTLTLNPDGSFTYTPVANYNGPDSFTYQATDGSLNSATATVNITVNAVNDAPVAVNDSFSGPEDTAIIGNVLINDTDVDGDTLTAVILANASHGTVTLNPDGSFTYTPVANYNGSDSFTYQANDGALLSAPATVSLTITPVEDPPVAQNDGGDITYSVTSGSTLSVPAPGILANDTDPDGDPLHVSAVVTGPAHGTITSINPDGSFTYTPNTGYVGQDTFTYTVSDGTLDSAPATVTITVLPNPIPTFGVLAGPIKLNGQTGLFEQLVTVTNTGTVTAEAFRVTISGLATNVTVYNATGTSNGVPYVHYNAPLNPNQTVTMILEFFNPKRTAFSDTLAALADTFTTTGTNAATGVHIDKIYLDTTGRVFIEFPSIVGRTYEIIYSDDLNTWKVSTPSITAGSTLTQWYDDGPPKTDLMPANRSYRAILVPLTP